jgi:hypothetical protein
MIFSRREHPLDVSVQCLHDAGSAAACCIHSLGMRCWNGEFDVFTGR